MKNFFTTFKDNCGFGLLTSINNEVSHKNLKDAITALSRMMHRGAVAADGKTGDGSGLLLSIPKEFMEKEAKKQDILLPKIYAIAMIFSKNKDNFKKFENFAIENDLKILMRRDVPIEKDALGEYAIKSMPIIKQIFIAPNSITSFNRFEAMIYLTRKETEEELKDDDDFYIPSFSTSTISYKGLVMPTHIRKFYKDLENINFKISFALFHQRFSTNTLPKWKLAQPFRNIAHNGEINSIEANRFNVAIKMSSIKSKVFSDKELSKISDIIQKEMSDSASLDNFLEFLLINGVDFFKAIRSILPPPWQNAPHMDANLRAFYEYKSSCFEAWDGPAAVSITDGRFIGCVLDRNGLRPSKYIITKDNRLIISSEYGVLQLKEDEILERGRLQSGEMMGVDLKLGKILKNSDINNYLKSEVDYNKWINKNMIYLQEYINSTEHYAEKIDQKSFEERQRYFNITHEILDNVIKPMIKDKKEATGSMGDDTPIPAFSKIQRNFSDFFKQKFAQVTNPPIDSIREKMVMSLNTGFGEIRNILEDNELHSKRLKSISPILSKEKFEVLLEFGDEKNPKYDSSYKSKIYSTTFEKDLKLSLDQLINKIIQEVKKDNIYNIFLDDRGVNKSKKTIPMLMVASRLNRVLLDKNLRHLTSIIVVTGEVFDSHMSALMIAFGVTAIYPYFLFQIVANIKNYKDLTQPLKDIRNTINTGLMKIMSKMGISTIASYRNSSLLIF